MHDLEDFQGTWLAVWRAQDGLRIQAEEVGRTTLTIAGDHYTFHHRDADWSGTIDRIVRTRNHGAVDFVPEEPTARGKPCRGIYVLEDDELAVCVAPPGQERPASFAPLRGSGHSLYLLKRSVPPRGGPVELEAEGLGIDSVVCLQH